MRTIKAMGAAIMSVLAIGALAASASAAEFHSTKEGALEARALNSQVFVTKAGTVSCNTLTAKGTALAGSGTTLLLSIQLSKCNFLGFISGSITPLLYLLMSSGLKDLTAPVTITTLGCTITIPAQSGLGETEYINNEGALIIDNKLTGITSYGEGSTCEYAEESSGTVNGRLELEAAGSELSYS